MTQPREALRLSKVGEAKETLLLSKERSVPYEAGLPCMLRRLERLAGKMARVGRGAASHIEKRADGQMTGSTLEHSSPSISKAQKSDIALAEARVVRSRGESSAQVLLPHSSVSSRSRCVLDRR